MTFAVQPAWLGGYAGQVSRGADDAARVRDYLDQYKGSGGFDGALIELVRNAYTGSMSAAITMADKVARILHASEEGLSEAASYYRNTDAAAAARADATVPGRCATIPTALEEEWTANACAPSFLDSREPSARLKPVDDVEFTHPLAFLDDISVSNSALKGFDFVFGFNPLEKIAEFLLGDWKAVANAGVAIGRAADALHDLGYNVQGGAIALRGGWQGAAADAGYAHFTGLASGINALIGPMREISKQFESIAHGVYSFSEAATGWVKGMIDSAVVAGIAAAAGTVTAETGVGAVIGYGVAAYEVARILDLWYKGTSAMNALYGVVQGAVGFIEVNLSQLYGADLPEPSGYPAYRHPVVAAAS
ncbi:WXG100 family type VII secretion target [Planosporangium flavigriseum]|uniref:WXG100 family type VII secretion target n=1 Tax=Planosporangium flavigriseum TaxID=373681 RepID=A0A8J3LW75_9ACTN|nr:WXG100 family type VII secretion target [Planosporangium flavigriseum]NJC63558.1 WXG100 family type VII secretion target [Planosporangium flavigriseum]GIG72255.1 hypothetical protein Pfl04_06590 [Planosporangium flavigriseum]